MKNQIILNKKGRARLLIIFTGTYFFSALAALSFAPLLPFIEEEMFLSKASLGLFTSILYIGAMLSGFPAGWLSDRWGVPKTILVGLIIHGISTCIITIFYSFSWMLFFVLLSGFGFGAVNPATSKGIIMWFEAKSRATSMAVKQLGYTAGIMAAAILLPVLALSIGWRPTVLIVGIIVIICGISTYFLYPASIKKKTILTEHEPVKNTVQTDSDKSVWKNKEILFWSFLCIFYAGAQACGTTYMAVYMVDCFSYSKIMAGIFLGITQGGGALGRIAWGRMSDLYFADRRENEIVLIGFIAAVMCILLGILPYTTHTIIIGIVAAVFGFTAIGFNVLFITHIGEIAGPEKAGQAIGVWVTIAYIGAVVPPPLFGSAIDSIGYKYSWVCLGITIALAASVALAYTKKKYSAAL